MKTSTFCLVFAVLFAQNGFAQTIFPGQWDTIFVANFESNSPFEPTDLMLGAPTGADVDWVNYDADGYEQFCYEDTTTFGWFPAFDFTDPTHMSQNYAFTSCSFTENATYPCLKKTRNWLIMPPIDISGNLAALEWKSATYYGPYWVDGYKVLVSTTDNLPASFTDTLFVAAQMVRSLTAGAFGTLDPAKYIYSPGYVHANKYTLPEYYLLEVDPASGSDFFLGQFEPHTADLSKYAGQRIYIAFVHDSDCDDKLQIDDLLVVDNHTLSGNDAPDALARFNVSPNPVRDRASVVFGLKNAAQVSLRAVDLAGKTIWQSPETLFSAGQHRVEADFSDAPAGVYFFQITADGRTSAKRIAKVF